MCMYVGHFSPKHAKFKGTLAPKRLLVPGFAVTLIRKRKKKHRYLDNLRLELGLARAYQRAMVI